MNTEVLLIGGPRSGKSTLVGGLIKYLTVDSSGHDGYYNVVREYDDSFDSSVIDNMENYRYPSRTSQHVVEITVKDESVFFPRDEVMTVFDFGGEFQFDVLGTDSGFLDMSVVNRLPERETVEVPDDRWPEEDVGDSIEDWFTSVLKECKGVIFLMNLKRFIEYRENDNDTAIREGFISPSTLESDLVETKDKKALVITATDLIDYYPDTSKDSLTTSMFDKTIYDMELFDRLNDTFQSSRMMAALRIVDDKDDFDLFGVSVPPGEHEDTLAREGGTFQTEGFKTLATWVLK